MGDNNSKVILVIDNLYKLLYKEYMMDTVAISDLRSNLPDIINKVSKNLSRIVVTVSGRPKAVVLSLEEIESLEETAEILSIPNAYEMIKKGEKQAKKSQGILLKKVR